MLLAHLQQQVQASRKVPVAISVAVPQAFLVHGKL
jgi:hypothetical protein